MIIHISNYIIFYVLPSFIHLLVGNSGFGKPHMNVKQKFKSVGIICRRYMFTMRAEFYYLAQLHNPSCNDWGGGRSWFPFCGYFHIYVEKVKLFNVHNKASQNTKTRAMITKMTIWSLNPLKRLGSKICLLFVVKCRNTHIPVM